MVRPKAKKVARGSRRVEGAAGSARAVATGLVVSQPKTWCGHCGKHSAVFRGMYLRNIELWECSGCSLMNHYRKGGLL